jgi:hypothetical protein
MLLPQMEESSASAAVTLHLLALLLRLQLYNEPSPAVAKLLANNYLPPHSLRTPPAAAAGPSGVSSSSSNSGDPARPDGLPLFSFLLSGLKFYSGTVGKAPQQQQQPAGPIELLMYCANAMALLLAMSELNDGPGGATSVQHRWLVLAGRLLASTGQALKVSGRVISTSQLLFDFPV